MVLGSGGREHALAAKFKKSPHVEVVYVCPGSDGMRDVAQVVPIGLSDHQGLIQFAQQAEVDLVVVGPEDALAEGIVDAFESAGLRVFGPSKKAAQLESSKSFAKEIMREANIPTADYAVFTSYEQALIYLEQHDYPVVLKASGLAAGKGVSIVSSFDEAKRELHAMMIDQKFSDAAREVVIESYLEGEEFSYLSLVYQEGVIPLQIAQDHKRAFDGDQGLNTGGMGAYTPVASISEADLEEARTMVVEPLLNLMKQRNEVFNGVLYAGLIKTAQGIKVIEFNVRFGDPETEVILEALDSDLYSVIVNLMDHRVSELAWSSDAIIGVVLASVGYPDVYENGFVIEGLDDLDSHVYHMGTCWSDHHWVNHGGRVLFVVNRAPTLKEAQEKVYHDIDKIHCNHLFYRRDIGFHNLKEDV